MIENNEFFLNGLADTNNMILILFVFFFIIIVIENYPS